MSLMRECEWCDKTIEPSEAETWWFKVNGKDACSAECAEDAMRDAILKLRERQHKFIDGSDGELECTECGCGPDAPWHHDEARDPFDVSGVEEERVVRT